MKKDNTSIFVVEDDNFFAHLVKESLSKKNFNNVTVFNSGEACLSNMEEAPEVVILDHGLGKMNGLDVLRKIKTTNPMVQVIFLSAQEKMSVAVKSLRYGAYDYLEKNSQSLDRVAHMVRRIRHHNVTVRENLMFKRFRRFFVIGILALIVVVVYLGSRYPFWFTQ
jgi:DNA-binding NtrC family response regulator